MLKILCLLFFLINSQLYAQNNLPKKIEGKVTADLSNLEGIYVINLNTEYATITDREGFFSTLASVGDTLLLSAIQFQSTKMVVTPENMASPLFFVKMKPIMYQLREVIVRRYPHISAEALGIIPYGQKKYTPAERKLAAATFGKLNPMGLDPILNFFSGRTAMLKKELEVEKKETYLRQLESMFDKNHFVNKLHIPSMYVKGFLYYAAENPKFTRVLETKNATSIEFLLAVLATKYNEIIAPKKDK